MSRLSVFVRVQEALELDLCLFPLDGHHASVVEALDAAVFATTCAQEAMGGGDSEQGAYPKIGNCKTRVGGGRGRFSSSQQD